MKAVADTNLIVSGLLWRGPPNQILRWARDGRLELLACLKTAEEIKKVIQYERFSQRLSELNITADAVCAYYMNLGRFVSGPIRTPTAVQQDSFDNVFLALASENKAHLIISGDNHLLELKSYLSIPIVTPSEAVKVLKKLS